MDQINTFEEADLSMEQEGPAEQISTSLHLNPITR